jgi:hypothetical protein
VLAVRETGTTVNDNPVVGLRVRLTPTDGGAPVEGEKTALVSRLNIRASASGSQPATTRNCPIPSS